MTLFLLLEYIGTAVFAISGALAAMDRKLDPFGVAILAFVTAVGGGTLRDVLIGRTPVGWMHDINFTYIIIGAAIASMFFRSTFARLRRTIFIFDAIGLGLFTTIGVDLGLAAHLHPVICVLLGTLTASFGGVIRDILSNEVPLIFRKEIYASLSLLGGSAYLLLKLQTTLESGLIVALTASVVVVLRVLAVRYKWTLPQPYNYPEAPEIE